MPDLLRLDYINSLPQPFMVTLMGGGGDYELNDIDVGTGLLRFNVCGLLQAAHIADVKHFTDMDGIRHDPDYFYTDYEG